MSDLETRLSQIEQLVRELAASAVTDASKNYRDDAEKLAIADMLILVAARSGLSRDEFVAAFDARFKFRHDMLLRGLEDQDPSIAAMLDQRDIEDVDTTDNPGDSS